jgi:hypothetical protein
LAVQNEIQKNIVSPDDSGFVKKSQLNIPSNHESHTSPKNNLPQETLNSVSAKDAFKTVTTSSAPAGLEYPICRIGRNLLSWGCWHCCLAETYGGLGGSVVDNRCW